MSQELKRKLQGREIKWVSTRRVWGPLEWGWLGGAEAGASSPSPVLPWQSRSWAQDNLHAEHVFSPQWEATTTATAQTCPNIQMQSQVWLWRQKVPHIDDSRALGCRAEREWLPLWNHVFKGQGPRHTARTPAADSVDRTMEMKSTNI